MIFSHLFLKNMRVQSWARAMHACHHRSKKGKVQIKLSYICEQIGYRHWPLTCSAILFFIWGGVLSFVFSDYNEYFVKHFCCHLVCPDGTHLVGIWSMFWV